MTNTGIINQTLLVYKLDIHEIEVEETLAATLPQYIFDQSTCGQMIHHHYNCWL